MAIEITTMNFDTTVKGKKPVLIDFWAPWCGPCRMLGPIVEEFANENEDVVVGKVNIDEHSDLASKFGVMSIPTLILFKGGEVAAKTVGVISKEEMANFVKQ